MHSNHDWQDWFEPTAGNLLGQSFETVQLWIHRLCLVLSIAEARLVSEYVSFASYARGWGGGGRGGLRHLLYTVCRCAQPLSEASLPKLASGHKPVKVFLCLKRNLQKSTHLSKVSMADVVVSGSVWVAKRSSSSLARVQ